MTRSVDLNADLGESYGRWQLGDDHAMLQVISSANIACGFHAGDPATLRETCRAAVEHGVIIGAQVGYHDLPGFGRRFIDIAPAELTAEIVYQVGALEMIAASVGGSVQYLKPHGALYHAVAEHRGQAGALIDALRALPCPLPLLGMPGSLALELAREQQLPTVTEYFVDRAYTEDGRLVDRRRPDALITDPQLAARRAVDAATEQRAESFCTHGDSPGAVRMAEAVRDALARAGIQIAPFVDAGRP